MRLLPVIWRLIIILGLMVGVSGCRDGIAATTLLTPTATPTPTLTPTTTPALTSEKYSGIGIHPSAHQMAYPSSYWENATNFVNSKVPNTGRLDIWVIGVDWPDGKGYDMCHLTFPKPSGTYQHFDFSDTDDSEAYLSSFDAGGIKVLLEIEPGDADIPTAIDLALTQYGHHSCVAGISIDIEWIHPSSYPDGKAVTDTDASTWLAKIKSYDPNYILNLVHWKTNEMPPKFRDANLILQDDGLNLRSYAKMLSSFKDWGHHFSNANVGFIVGFDEDWSWISKLSDPADTIMNSIFSGVPNCRAVYWAPWTIPDIFAAYTPLGTNVAVALAAGKVTFSNVTGAGTTTMSASPTAPCGSLPSGFNARGLAIRISTTAIHSGNVSVAIAYGDFGIPTEKDLRLFHCDGMGWKDVTSPLNTVDTANKVIYGQDTSLSWWQIGHPTGPSGGGGAGVPLFPNIYIAIATALVATVLAYLVRRRLVGPRRGG
jgi:hypothetical protein